MVDALNANQTKTISIEYSDFENIPPGEYKVWFNYPGLHSQIEKTELNQNNGRIWLGELKNIKLINID